MDAIDTNVLVYAIDRAYPEKRQICKKIVEDIFMGRKSGVVTNQILAEFAAAVTMKIEIPLKKKDAAAIIGAILTRENWNVVNYTGEMVLEALESEKPFWDALITQTLKRYNIQKIITENVKDFEGTGLMVENPFK